MYCIEIPKGMKYIISSFYFIGVWYRGDDATVREIGLKIFYSIYYLLFAISFMAGAITNDNKDQSIFQAECSIAEAVLSMKLLYLIWRKKEILEILTRVGNYSTEDRVVFTLVADKLNKFMKFIVILIIIICTNGYFAAIVPIFGSDNELFLKIAFPLDWKNNKLAFWIANAFNFTEVTLSVIAFLLSVIIWYLLVTCALRYEILESKIRNMGVIRATENRRKVSDVERHKLFLRDLISSINSHQHTRELINQVDAIFSNLFFVQIVTSGLCICGSIYCLALNISENFLEQLIHLISLLYNIADIFMIMYFGNEIKCSSERLIYSLFESNWIDQPQATKKYIITFAELLKQPHELIIGQLYTLTLETFIRVLHFAYDAFNILKNLN